MPTHLTRLVIRRILSNEPIVYRDCLCRRANACLQPRPQRLRRNAHLQTRSFFGFARESTRQVKDADFTPGLEKMIELNRAQNEKARPPKELELCKAFKQLITTKNSAFDTLSDVEAGHALNTFRHLEQRRLGHRSDTESTMPYKEILHTALNLLGSNRSQRSDTHVTLAEEIFKYLEATRTVQPETPGLYGTELTKCFFKTIAVLCLNGEPLRARELLVEKYKKHGWKSEKEYFLAKPWISILEAFYTQKNDAEAQKTLRVIQELGIPIGQSIKWHLLKIHAQRGDLEATRKCYEELSELQGELNPPGDVYNAMLKCCLKHNENEWGQSIVRSMLGKLELYYDFENPGARIGLAKEMWDSLFLWAAASGKGVDEVDRMINIMVRRTFKDGRSVQPDIETINQLVEWCMSQKQPYFAERYIALGLKWGIHPNATTYDLQIMYRLSGGDIDGARAAYRLLQAEDCSKQEDVAAANKLIQAMCKSGKYGFTAVMALVDDLNERKARFEPETVSVLSLLHIERNELHDVIDLLQTHVFHFSEEQRLKIADTLVAIVLDRAHTSITRAWDTYIITQSIFAELPRETRTNIMREFFTRGRADMACHVFAHMRELQHPDTRATADTYVAALVGIAEYSMPRVSATDSDIDADERNVECSSLLDAVHNAMKLDIDIEPSTRLRNALVLAYTAAGKPARAWGFWEDIVNSREGPSYNSIPIAFRACERMSVGGEKHARALWTRLRKMDIEISKGMLAAYVGALAGNQNVDEAKEVVLKAEKEFGWRPDAFL
ncbi:hypothetical protein SLS56_008412 [Neofusicoccum ribis]|uniref:Complex I intermediate-associated protein 84 n=1 Tax=Neofusicoccum ribis TaxID=45134 RepID=A0ABR3SKA3_9PEZI